MRSTPLLLLAAVGASLLLAGGCQRNSVEVEELRAENARLSNELDKVYAEAALLKKQRDAAREENVRLREQLEGMEQQIRSFAGMELDKEIIEVDMTSGALIVKDVAFKLGSAELNQQAIEALRQLARELKSGEYVGTNVIVVGHTDNTPVVRAETKEKFGDNWGLSALRAAAVIRALKEAGVGPDRLRGSFRGEHAERASNATKEGKAANRRVEIFLSLPNTPAP